ncbi:MAG TPA: hypothetical protein VK853_05820 [Ilumatobacteraceae bacterium]|nr:hypothetical protein [Ilumatobacteraceae bacterium]
MRMRPAVAASAVILVAPFVWFMHLSVVYALVPISCRWNSDLPMHAATLVAAVGVAGSIRVARRAHAEATGAVSDGRRPDRTMEMIALALSAYFALLVVMTATATVVVDRCA